MKIIIICLTALLLYSCGSDNPVTNNPQNPGSVDTVALFEKDSIYTGTLYNTRDSIEGNFTVSIDTLHGSFLLCSENAKRIYAYIKSGTTFEVNRIYSSSPDNEEIKFTLIPQSSFKIYLQIVEALTPTYRASLKNIKLWYIKRS